MFSPLRLWCPVSSVGLRRRKPLCRQGGTARRLPALMVATRHADAGSGIHRSIDHPKYTEPESATGARWRAYRGSQPEKAADLRPLV